MSHKVTAEVPMGDEFRQDFDISSAALVALALEESVCPAKVESEGVCGHCSKERHRDELGRCSQCGAGVCGMQACSGNCKHH